MRVILNGYNRFKTYILNSSWIMGEKLFTIGVGFLVTVLIARYLGPERYGILAYALSLTALFASAGHMGLGGLVVRELVRKPDSRPEIIGTSIALKLLGFLVGFIALLIYALVFEDRENKEFLVLIVVASALFFKPFDVIDFWFQAHVQAKYTAIARSASFFFTACFNVLLVLISAELLFFAFSSLLQSFLAACFLLLLFRSTANIPITTWRVSLMMAKQLWSHGWVIFLGAIFSSIYLKLDQIMLKWLTSAEEVGIYSVAATLSEAWYFVPSAIIASLFPNLIKLKEENKIFFNASLQKIFDILFILALSVALVVNFMAEPLMEFLFGQQYLASAPILAIHIFASLFIFMRAAFSMWILIENALIFSLITQGLGALANIGLNFLLIPKYSGYGAAVATLLSYATASYFSLFFYKKTRPIFWMMSKAMMSPIRYPLSYIKRKAY
ncbi:MAG: flippase [Deltaproteobacteria bacterium HGW-Deltaproteobacteria-4]|nr:MAG: flippase [Deltaproteobacteria bacterium HGW-Deltaproteobacteria-4]